MKKEQGEELAEYKNGHRNPNSPRLMTFESGEEIEREIKKPRKSAKKKKKAAEGNSKKTKKKKGKGNIDPGAN